MHNLGPTGFLSKGAIFFSTLLLLVILLFPAGPPLNAEQKTIYFYYGQGCPHCALVESFFSDTGVYDQYRIEKREVYFNRANATAFNRDMNRFGVPEAERAVPTVIADSNYLMGDKPIINGFSELAKDYKLSPEEMVALAASKEADSKPSTLAIFAGAAAIVLVIAGMCVIHKRRQKHRR
jgi:hypothetical protein